MFEKMTTMRMVRDLMGHAANRQNLIARNVANADTPGYKAADLAPFADMAGGATPDMRTTRPGHLAQVSWGGAGRVMPDAAPASPNGNTVSLEEEMLKAAEIKRENDLSVGIYRSAMDLMRTSLGRRG